MKKLERNIIPILTIIYLIYEEIIFSILTNAGLQNIVLKALFSTLIAIVINIITSLFNKKTNKILYSIIFLIISIIYTIYYAYYKIFDSAISLYSLSKGMQVLQFTSTISNVVQTNWYGIVLLLLPTIIYFIAIRKISIEKANKERIIVYISSFFVLYVASISIIKLDKEENIYSEKNLYYNINNATENLKQFGLLTTIRLDIQRTIFPFSEKNLYEYKDENGNSKVIDMDQYNMIEIDFDSLIENENNEEIKEIHKYLSQQEPTQKNEYTGKYAGKNLIVIVGESFSSLAIREDLTPTLYKLANEGIKFKNFYTPLFPVSTADGEYLTDTALLPAEGTWSIEKVEGNTMPYSYANVLKKEGYKTYAYHNYKYDYYNRDKYFETMGYDTYLAQGNGLEEKMDFSVKPSSDYDMIKSTITDYINDDKFLAYYMTMSGHMAYDQTNAMVVKNWDKVKDLPYSDKAKAYLATQIELDKAVEELIRVLEKNNKLKDTVILISGDHYPYGLNEDEIKELSPYDMNNYYFEKFHMPLIIYNPGNEDIEIDKYASSLDILPTILNLFGIKYDSRLLMGKDIFSNSNPLVIFSDRSFITEKGKYNSLIEKFYSEEYYADEEYIKNIKQEIYLKYRCSRLMLKNDYYASIMRKIWI